MKMWVRTVLTLLVAATTAAGLDIDLCVPNCSSPRPLVPSNGELVSVTACEGHTVNLTFWRPGKEGDASGEEEFTLRVTDLHQAEVDHVIYYATNNITTQANSHSFP
jgi:hypothetical protein